MLKNITLILSLILTLNIVAQERYFFKKNYPNSTTNLEFGAGYLFNPNLIRYQVASRNILLNNKLGFMYTIESNADIIYDVLGLNYRISKDLSFQAGIGLATKSIFNSEGGIRKEISIAYHPDYMPLSITTGYSKSIGPSFTVNYRIFINKKKEKEKVKFSDKSTLLNKKGIKKNSANNELREKSSTRALMYPPSTIIAAKNTNSDSKESKIKKPIKEKTSTKKLANQTLQEKTTNSNVNSTIKKAISQEKTTNSNVNSTIKKAISQEKTTSSNLNSTIKTPVQKEIKEPTINITKLCNDSRISHSLNMYDLSSIEKKNLRKLARYLKENPTSRLKIFGSTDKSGSEEYNLRLSVKRANSSKNYLIQLGVLSNQLETIYLGESKSQNANSEEERANARATTFKIIIQLP